MCWALEFFFIQSIGLQYILGLAQICAFIYNPNRDNLSKSWVELLVIFLNIISIVWSRCFGLPLAYKILMIWILSFRLALPIHKDCYTFFRLNGTTKYFTRGNSLCLFLGYMGSLRDIFVEMAQTLHLAWDAGSSEIYVG